MKRLLLPLAFGLPLLGGLQDPEPQAITSRVETTPAGERILIEEVILEAPVAKVWAAYTIGAGLGGLGRSCGRGGPQSGGADPHQLHPRGQDWRRGHQRAAHRQLRTRGLVDPQGGRFEELAQGHAGGRRPPFQRDPLRLP
ncbi:MAG: hypothetical protein GY930_07880 [bacterium]|nr:hypothetical protein [bacterium]